MTASASRRRFLMRLGCISSAAAACSIPTVCAWAAGTHTPVVVSFSWFENVNSAELAKPASMQPLERVCSTMD